MSQLKYDPGLNESTEVLSGTVSKGDAVAAGPTGEEFVLIYRTGGVSGDTVTRAAIGIHEVSKNTGVDLAFGERVYYDTSASEFTSVATGNVYAGRAWEAVSTTTAVFDLNLNIGNN